MHDLWVSFIIKHLSVQFYCTCIENMLCELILADEEKSEIVEIVANIIHNMQFRICVSVSKDDEKNT